MKKSITPSTLTKLAVVAAIYIVITVVLGPIGSGAIQFRLSEMFNLLAFYNRRYIASVTIGCAISNYLVYGPVDMIVGSLASLVFITLGVILFHNKDKIYFKNTLFAIPQKFIFFNILFSLSMFVIALELNILFQAPFFLTWLTTGLGEFLSLMLGAYVVQALAKRIDFTNV
ncbi:MAG: QueT transporter family protein [Streptococcaceae bacterium]|jgi:uncharacterized membrane protein|nr:QueT transporter family protein [Streptococcaceae bacterium]